MPSVVCFASAVRIPFEKLCTPSMSTTPSFALSWSEKIEEVVRGTDRKISVESSFFSIRRLHSLFQHPSQRNMFLRNLWGQADDAFESSTCSFQSCRGSGTHYGIQDGHSFTVMDAEDIETAAKTVMQLFLGMIGGGLQLGPLLILHQP